MSKFICVHTPLVLTVQHINVNYFMYHLSDNGTGFFFLEVFSVVTLPEIFPPVVENSHELLAALDVSL